MAVSVLPPSFMFFFVLTLSHSLLPHSGVPGVNGDRWPHPLRAQPAPHHGPHPRRVCLSGAGVQWSDRHLHLSADTGAVEPGCRAAGGLLHCHRPWLHLPLCRWLLRQWGHRHLRPAVHLLPLGMHSKNKHCIWISNRGKHYYLDVHVYVVFHGYYNEVTV